MLTLKGDISITNRIQDLEKCRFTHKIIMIGEPDTSLAQEFNAIAGSLFMPPYEAVMQEMDGNLQAFHDIYANHLMSIECQEYIALIFRALYEGKNILLYLTKDESELAYSKVLLEFMAGAYGLLISPNIDIPASFSQTKSTVVSDLLYLYDLFTIEEYFINRLSEPINGAVLGKLVNELNPYVEQRTYEAYNNYFMRLDNMIKGQGRFVMNGLTFEEK